MQKICLSLILILGFSLTTFAQINEEELRLNFEKIQKEMEEAMKQMQESFGEGHFLLMDTMIMRSFPFQNPEDRNPGLNPSDGSLGLAEMFSYLMEQMNATDWNEMERLLEEFEEAIPAPGDFQEDAPKEGATPGEKRKPRKKRRAYSL